MSKDVAIRTRGLTRDFGAVKAVAGLDLEVRPGELFGIVGPDGAGKTTTLRMLAAILDPTGGEAFVAGHSVMTEGERIKEKIGYMSQRFGLYEDLTVLENINFYADLYEVAKDVRPERIERLLGFSNLTPFKQRLAGKLSGGMKQKLGLACALIHTPEILFLDEPTNGVDPVSRRDFWRILYGLLKEGITIVVSTAYLDEAERCSRVGLMNYGRLLAVDEPEALKKSLGIPMVELWVEDARSSAACIREIEGVESVAIYGDKLHVAVSEKDALERFPAEALRKGIALKGTREVLPSLEDIFIFMVEGGRR